MAIKVMDLYAALRTEGKDRVAGDIRSLEKQAVAAASRIEHDFGQGFSRGFGQAGQALEAFGGRVGNVAGLLTNKFALAGAAVTGLGAALTTATKAAIAFETEFAKSRVFLSGTPQQIAAIEKSLHGLDARLGTATELLPTFRKALLDSGDPKVALRMTELAAAFAKVSGASPEQAVSALGSLMDSFGIKVEQASRITDGLFTIMKGGGGEVGELLTIFPQLADAAKEFGVTLEDLGGALNTLGQVAGSDPQKNARALLLLFQQLAVNQQKFTDRGVDVRALTQQYGGLVGILKALEQAATDANGQLSPQRLNELGLSGRNLIAIMKLLNDGVQQLAENTRRFGAEAPGAVTTAAQSLRGSYAEEFKRLGAEFEKLRTELGKPFVVPITFAVSSAADLLKLIRESLTLPGNIVSQQVLQQSITPEQRTAASRAAFEAARAGERDRGPVPSRAATGPPSFPAVLAAQRERALAGRIGRFELEARQARRGTVTEEAIERATAATVAGLRTRIGGLGTEIGILGKSTEGTAEQRLVQIETLRTQQEALERQIVDVVRDAEEEKRKLREKSKADAVQRQKEATQAILEEIKKEETAARKRFETDVALGRVSVREQIARAQQIAADVNRPEEERLDAMVEAFTLEKRLAEDALDFRKALNMANVQDEIRTWAARAKAAQDGSQVQIDAMKRVAELTKQARSEAESLAQQVLGLGKGTTVSKESAARDVERERRKDREIIEKYNVGGKVNRQRFSEAIGRQGFFQQLSAAGGAGAVLSGATAPLGTSFAQAMGGGGVPFTDLQRRALAIGDVGMARDLARQDLGFAMRKRELYDERISGLGAIFGGGAFPPGTVPGFTGSGMSPDEQLRHEDAFWKALGGPGGGSPRPFVPRHPHDSPTRFPHLQIMPESPVYDLGNVPGPGAAADPWRQMVDSARSAIDEIKTIAASQSSAIARSIADRVSDFIAADIEILRG